MEKSIATDRVRRLREQYLNCPMLTKHITYDRALRQRLLYCRGWELNRNQPTTRLRRAYAEAYILEHMAPVIHDDQLIAGCPDFSPLTPEEEAEYQRYSKEMTMAPTVVGIAGHMSLDFAKLLDVGVDGLIEEIRVRKSGLDLNEPDDMRKDEFYEGCLVELKSLLTLSERYSVYARVLAQDEPTGRAEELREIADILERVPRGPASTLREALQSVHFYSFALWDLYLIGRPDQILLKYYESDIEKGILVPEQAQELIDCFCLLYTTYITPGSSIGFMIGGRDREGRPVDNALTRMFLQSISHTRMAYPSIGLAVNEETNEELLRFSVRLLAEGHTHPAIYNDSVITKGLRANGLTDADSHDYVHSACVEITPCARSGCWNVSPYHNLALMLLEAMAQDNKYQNIDELIEAFAAILRKKVIEAARLQNLWQIERSRNGGEPMRVSCLVRDCLARGRSVDEGGAIYNFIMPNFVGMANVVDGLAAIQKLVFESHELTLHEFNDILNKNYNGYEAFRYRIINKMPHFGNNEPLTDGLAQRISLLLKKSCQGIGTWRSSFLVPSAFSYREHASLGKQTPATPDGRLAGTPLADGSGAVQGMEVNGPTAAILSDTCWDQMPFLGGIAINIKFSADQMTGESEDKIIALIKTFLDRGGLELQVNAVNSETLRKARQNPEQYRDLIVRVGGYSDFFVLMSPELQAEMIERTEHRLV